MTDTKTPFTLVGAGLAGSLLAVLLARQGRQVELFERYPDPRKAQVPAGRSINLALAERGRQALRAAGLLERIERFALPMVGRQLHNSDGSEQLQNYGQRVDEVIWSVHRGNLNVALLDAAEEAGVKLHFAHRLVSTDFDEWKLHFADADGHTRQHDFDLVIGADGAGSALRRSMDKQAPLGIREEPLGHGYLELTIPPDAQGEFQLRRDALHIWPRGSFMMIALPNPDASFTCTLFLQNSGDPGFEQLRDPASMRAFLEQHFSDAVALMPDLDQELSANPVGFLGTLYVERWTHAGRAVLIGDAAHAIVPFHGQGMNAAFEDTVELARQLATHPNQEAALAAFEKARKPNADAIAAMALDNYLEMRDRVRDPGFHLKKQLEWTLESLLPEEFIPRYAMVMFHPEIPYAEAFERGQRQAELLDHLAAGHAHIDEFDTQALVGTARQYLGRHD